VKKLLLRKIAGKLHLWFGLAAGIVIFIISITGSIYVFQQEISSLWYKDILYTDNTSGETLPVNTLWKNAQEALPNEEEIVQGYIYKNPRTTWSFLAYKYDPAALTYFGNFVYYKWVYVNPHNGRITGIIDYKYDFFNIIKYIHWSLLLKTEIGQPIIGWSTLIFVVMTITGIILWWPRNKNAVKQRLTLNFKGHWKRNNYNLHNVSGFYILFIVLIIAITGLVYAFTWMDNAIYFLATGSTQRPVQAAVSSELTGSQKKDPLQKAIEAAQQAFPEWESIFTSGIPDDSTGTIYVNVNMRKGTYYKTNELYFNKYDGELLKGEYYRKLTAGEKFIKMNYDIHVGAIGGLPTKILAFIVSLTAASLPVTGFLIWIGRRKKKKK
jgi:uncharacterized iron-regulated membrane protein